jgi:hypothetical protein
MVRMVPVLVGDKRSPPQCLANTSSPAGNELGQCGLGTGTYGYIFDKSLGDVVLNCIDTKIPSTSSIFSMNEDNDNIHHMY